MDEQNSNNTITANDKQFNMQVNFYIMRKLWAVCNGKKRDGSGGDFYLNVFSSSRTRITRVIDGFKAKFSPKECMKIEADTGIPAQYINGEKRFDLMGVPVDDWRNYFELRNERRIDTETFSGTSSERRLLDLEKSIDSNIEKYYQRIAPTISNDIKTTKGEELFIYFLINNSPVNKQALLFIDKTRRYIEQNNINILKSIHSDELREYVKALKKHLSEAQAVLTVREAEERLKKSK